MQPPERRPVPLRGWPCLLVSVLQLDVEGLCRVIDLDALEDAVPACETADDHGADLTGLLCRPVIG